MENNLNEFAPRFSRVLVKDGHLIDSEKDWLTTKGPSGPFCYAHNVNLGIDLVHPDSDVLLMGDDVRFKDTQSIEKLYDLAYADNTLGLLSPRIIGGADNPILLDPPQDRDISYTERYVPLVCTYIKRSILNTVGTMDEQTFSKGFGWDDVDFSRRIRNAGLILGVTPRVEVIHGIKRKGSESLIRNEKGDREAMKALDEIGRQAYIVKWGDDIK